MSVNTSGSDSNDEVNEAEELALIGAMQDGWVKQFDFRGLQVRQVGASIEVTDDAERPLGGAMLMESATIEGVFEWLENKADLYEVAQ